MLSAASAIRLEWRRPRGVRSAPLPSSPDASGTTCPSCRADVLNGSASCPGCGAAAVPPRAGVKIGSRYRILAELGRGGMGTVYSARDEWLDEDVAIKVLRTDGADRSSAIAARRRLRSEIKLARRVTHPHVCRIHEYGEDETGLDYISMELVHGVTLKRLLRQCGPLAGAHAEAVGEQLLAGMDAIHGAGIIHRDLKPSNVMIDVRGTVKVMDFGIAKSRSAPGEEGVSTAGRLVGTPEYMSPEQARGQPLDVRTDVYTLAAVMFETYTGRAMFTGGSPMDVMLRHIQEPPPLASPEAGVIPEPIRAVLGRALAKTPDERYPTVRDMKEALTAARAAASRTSEAAGESSLADLVVSLAGVPPSEDTATYPVAEAVPPRRRVRFGPSGGVVLALLIGPMITVTGLVDGRRAPTSPPSSVVAQPRPAASAPPITDRPPAAEATIPSPPIVRRSGARPRPPSARPVPPSRPADPIGSAPAEETPPPVEVTAPVVPSEPTLRALIQALAEPALRTSAIEELVQAGQPAVPLLVEGLAARQEAVQSGASEALTRIGVGVGTLRLRIRPWADVTVDGRPIGTTPLRAVRLTAGTHTVELRHPGYIPLERTISVGSGLTTELQLDLRAEAQPVAPR